MDYTKDIKTCENLLKALRCALWGKPYDEALQPRDFKRIMHLAEQQTVQTMVFDALSSMSMELDICNDKDMEILTYCISMQQDVTDRNKLLNSETVLLSDIFQRENFEMLVVKGQTAAVTYLKPELRVSGDIDILIKDTQRDITQTVSKALDIDIPKSNAIRGCKLKHNDVTIEIHKKLRNFGNKHHQQTWDDMTADIWNSEPYYTEIEGQRVRTLPPTENAAFLFVHIFFHFIREGVSLRQMCDWARLLHCKHDAIDRGRLKALLDGIGLADAYRAFGSILTDKLGLPQEDFPFNITTEDRAWTDMILHDILRCGNFGQQIHSSSPGLRYKMETMGVTLRHTWRYRKLAPKEIRTVVPRLIKTNIKIFLHR